MFTSEGGVMVPDCRAKGNVWCIKGLSVEEARCLIDRGVKEWYHGEGEEEGEGRKGDRGEEEREGKE